MAQYDLALRGRVVTTAGERASCVGVSGGRVAAIEPYDTPLDAARSIELARDEVLLPGLVDTHVHVNEPGRTDWEGFATATRAAAAGGVTTILDMPLNSVPPTTDVGALEAKRKAADGQCHVDVGFWGGVVPGSVPEMRALHDAGVFGFKSFLLPSGVDEFPPLREAELEQALREAASFGGLTIVHAEDAATIDRAPDASGTTYGQFLASRPRDAENTAISGLVELARRTGARVHVLHLSSSDALGKLAAVRRDGVPVTVETCPHFLTFAAEEIPDGATPFKCCPPIREAGNRETLWRGLAAGTIDSIVSDHSPCTPDLKLLDTGDFGAAWGGVSSLQLDLPAVWTQARLRGHTLGDVARWMAAEPARLTGLRRKGAIAIGCDADFAVFAPDDAFVVDPHELRHKHPVTPYAGRALAGVVRSTWLRGQRITGEPKGRLLTRGET